MRRRQFVGVGCAGSLALLAGEPKPASEDLTQKPNPEQVMNVLKFVDGSGDESLRGSVFNRLGYECCHTRGLEQFRN